MDFVAIDFETACNNANSACQLAVVQVQDCEITNEYSWLIRPPRMYFSPRNISIHGIHPEQVQDERTFEQLWGTISHILDGQVIIAHNARFDIGVLLHSLAAYDIACPSLEFSCTRILARYTWPGRSKYGLKPIGSWLGIEFQHHDALEDARCCAKIAIASATTCEETTLEDLEKKLRITRGTYHQGDIRGPRAIGRKRGERGGGGRNNSDRWGFPAQQALRPKGSLDPAAIVAASANSQPLAGKTIFLTGPLRGLSLKESTDLVSQLGGECRTEISSGIDYVVACGTSLESVSHLVCKSLSDDNGQSKTNDISGIRLLSERQFRALLPAGKASMWQ